MNIELKIQKNIPLAQLTTFKIGGPAKYFIEVKTKDELVEALSWAKENNEKFVIFAGGSNVLINDKGIDGLVIKISNTCASIHGQRIECGAGANLAKISRLALDNSLTGLEWAINIPGTIGGAVRGNAGAYGRSIGDTIETIEIFNIKENSFQCFSRKDCKFSYKESVFKQKNNLLIWRVNLKLQQKNKNNIIKLSSRYLNSRVKSQPKLPSAGCIFKNIHINDLRDIDENLADEAKEAGIVKNNMIGAGWLVDRAGLKGKAIGGAKISLEHANFIINTGKAAAEDVIILISFIKQQVRGESGVQLKEEIQYLGF